MIYHYMVNFIWIKNHRYSRGDLFLALSIVCVYGIEQNTSVNKLIEKEPIKYQSIKLLDTTLW